MRHWQHILLLGVGFAFANLHAESGGIDPGLGPPFLLRERPWLGDRNAPVAVIEVSAFNCSHCQAFHRRLFPLLKKKYIETGLVRWTMLPTLPVPVSPAPPTGNTMTGFSLNPEEQNTRLATIAHVAAPKERYWEALNLLFKHNEIPRAELDGLLAGVLGMDVMTLREALAPTGPAFAETLIDLREGIQANIRRTPTFVIRKRLPQGHYKEARIEGYQPQDYFERVLEDIIRAQ